MWRSIIFVFLSFMISLEQTSAYPKTIQPAVVFEKELWNCVNNSAGEVNTYRSPIILATPNGTLIVIVQGRKYTLSDKSFKFLAMRRSFDEGQTWTATDFILDSGPDPDNFDSLFHGVMFYEHHTGAIFLTYSKCSHLVECTTPQVFIMKSFDEGMSWSNPINISAQVGTDHVFDAGPGYAVVKQYPPHRGRVLICGHGSRNSFYCIYSDDRGATWKNGGMMPSIPFYGPHKPKDFNGNENQPLELPDGTIMVNGRNNGFHCRCRMILYSFDGGESFPVENITFAEDLIEPGCQATHLFHNGVLYFANPRSTTKRINMTLTWSYDWGWSWNNTLQLTDKLSGYSCLGHFEPGSVVKEPDRYIYLAYNKGTIRAEDTIQLLKIDLYSNTTQPWNSNRKNHRNLGWS